MHSTQTTARLGRWLLLPGLAALLAVACSPNSEETGTETASERLEEAAATYQERQLERSPIAKLWSGEPVDTLPDVSVAAVLEDIEFAKDLLAQIEEIDPEALDATQRTSLAVLRYELETMVAGEPFVWHDWVLTPYQNPTASVKNLLGAVALDSPEAVDRYLLLLDQVPGFFDSLEGRVRGQLERGLVVPQPNMEPSLAIMRSNLDGESWAIPEERTSALSEEEQARLRDQASERIEAQILPRLEAFMEFLETEYRGAAPAGVGASQYPGGKDYYRYAVKRSITMDRSPEEIHERGLLLVSELEEAMDRVQKRIGFEGTRSEFRKYLQTDPKFFPTSPEQCKEVLEDASRRFEQVVDQYFASVPEAPWKAQRLDPALEASQTYGRYSPPTPAEPHGIYHFNGSNLEERTWITLGGIGLHELIPGHHFHIARQFANEEIPAFRRQSLFGAFTEGWGSYASFLGLEAGVYEHDPYLEYGMYMLEVFLATRLVVDTGMNYLGWSLEQAREFMREHTFESETQIGTESLRYSSDMPAQALAYQMGKLEILRLRAKATEELGEKFDLRDFHEVVLGQGAVPMQVLAANVERYIRDTKKRGEP